MNKSIKQFIFLVFLAVVIVSFSGCGKKEIVKDVQEDENVEVVENKEIKNENIEIQEISEEFELKPEIDMSDWQTYRNEEYGFSFKYPKDWFCGGIALAPDSKKSIFCSSYEFKNDYYKGKSDIGGVMIGVVNVDFFSNGEDDYGIITKTVKGHNFNLQSIYFPFQNNNKSEFLNIINSIKFTK